MEEFADHKRQWKVKARITSRDLEKGIHGNWKPAYYKKDGITMEQLEEQDKVRISKWLEKQKRMQWDGKIILPKWRTSSKQ